MSIAWLPTTSPLTQLFHLPFLHSTLLSPIPYFPFAFYSVVPFPLFLSLPYSMSIYESLTPFHQCAIELARLTM